MTKIIIEKLDNISAEIDKVINKRVMSNKFISAYRDIIDDTGLIYSPFLDKKTHKKSYLFRLFVIQDENGDYPDNCYIERADKILDEIVSYKKSTGFDFNDVDFSDEIEELRTIAKIIKRYVRNESERIKLNLDIEIEKEETSTTDNIDDEKTGKELFRQVKTIDTGFKRAKINNNLVFVIISLKPEMDDIFEGMKSAGEEFNLDVKRVIEVQGDYKITDKIVEMIQNAELIIADLTDERPNVYFELGYARGLDKEVITVARKGTILHFDVKDWTCIFYTDSRDLEKKLKKRFKADN